MLKSGYNHLIFHFEELEKFAHGYDHPTIKYCILQNILGRGD